MREINNFKEFNAFLTENELVYTGYLPLAFSKVTYGTKLNKYRTIEQVEKQYNVSFCIIRRDF